jgi:hypothetical protein
MNATRALLISGTVLLAVAALLGFVQERYRDRPERFAAWRVVHAGGTAGAVQLLALASVWERLAGVSLMSTVLAYSLALASWAFFLGPLARALVWPRLARILNIAGAMLAVPCYVALPFALLRSPSWPGL